MAVIIGSCSLERIFFVSALASMFIGGGFFLGVVATTLAEGGADLTAETSSFVKGASAVANTSSGWSLGKVAGDVRNISGGFASIGDLTRSKDSIAKSIILTVLTGGSSKSILGC